MQHVIRKTRPHARSNYRTLLKPNARLHADAQLAPYDGGAWSAASSKHGRASERRGPLEQIRVSPDQPTIIGDNGMRTYRLRKYGNKPLPLPEIMDPIYLEARHKYKQTKADAVRIEEELTPFQRKLARNPHAHALGTVSRQCRLTQVRLPQHFLAMFTRKAVKSDKVETDDTAAMLGHQGDRIISAKSSFLPTPHRGPRDTSRAYVLGTREVVEHLSKKANWKILVPESKRDQQWDWAKDMPDLYLQSLRNMVLTKLELCLLTSRLRQDTTGRHENVGCILLINKRDESPEDLFEAMSVDDTAGAHNQAIESASPTPYMYDLRKLFLPEQILSFLSQHDFKQDMIALRENRETTTLVMYVERLQNYIR